MAMECPVFRPSLEEFRNTSLEDFVAKHEGACQAAGVLKIEAPEGWRPRTSRGYDAVDLTVPRPIRQNAMGRAGCYRAVLVESKDLSIQEFKAQASAPGNAPPADASPEQLERAFWRGVTLNPPLYGADVAGSLFEERQEPPGWNLRRLSSLLSRTLDAHGHSVPGVTSPYLYLGSWRAFFAWHTEDLDLHSVNYLHCGAGKTWYVVPPAHRARFEQLVRGMLPEFFASCPEFMRHKELMLSPALLAAHSIPFIRVVHRPREFVVVLPGAYHAGFNHGFNIAETLNFATEAWVPLGARARACDCRKDSVRIDMRMFGAYMGRELREEVEEAWETEPDDSSSSEEGEEEEEEEGEEEDEGESEASVSEGEEDEVEEAAAAQRPKARKRPTAKAKAAATPRRRGSSAAPKTKPRTPGQAASGTKRRRGSPREGSAESETRENSPANKRLRASGSRPPKPLRPGKVPEASRPSKGYVLPKGAAHAAWGAPVAEERPVAVVERAEGTASPSFFLAHRLERKTPRPGCLWVGMLREDEDGLFRPTGVAKLAQLGMHFPRLARVRTEWQAPEGKRKGGWKLTTLAKRIVM